MGAHFHHPAFASTWGELAAFLDERHVALWAADAGGTPLHDVLRRDPNIPERLALAVGNEGSGLSSLIRERADKLVALPIAPAVESLNVAVATGILLYELRP
jgi:TrmH family RNA methyltransferase